MNNEKAMPRENLVEGKNRNKSVDNRMLYPTVTHFDDLFHEAIPSSKEQPTGWDRHWVFDNPEEDNGSIACALIGPYCKVSNGVSLWTHARDHLVSTVKNSMVGIPGDELYFDIVHKGKLAVVSVRHHAVVGRKLVARVLWNSVPHQEKALTSPS